jgi:hypothetical protein
MTMRIFLRNNLCKKDHNGKFFFHKKARSSWGCSTEEKTRFWADRESGA